MENTVQKNNKKWLIIGGAVLAVAVIVLVLVLWVFPGKDEDVSKGIGNDDITLGLKGGMSRDEVVRALEKEGYKLVEEESYLYSDDRFRLVYYDNVKLYGMEASRLLIEQNPDGSLGICYDFADYDADMPGCHHIRDAKAAHRKAYDTIVNRIGKPTRGDDEDTGYDANSNRYWEKSDRSYMLSDYHGDGTEGQFYFGFDVR